MKERPILFSAEMIRAIIAGTKTQTRRIIPIPGYLWAYEESTLDISYNPLFGCYDIISDTGLSLAGVPERYGEEGDILWVRETWQPMGYLIDDGDFYIKFMADDGRLNGQFSDHKAADKYMDIIDNELNRQGLSIHEDGRIVGKKKLNCRMRPAIHMFKDFSRIWLKITHIRFQRLNEISKSEAIAEGIVSDKPLAAYEQLWEKINGAGSWAENPLVWVIEFEVLSITGKPAELEAALHETI